MSDLTRRMQFGWLLLRGVATREIPPGAAWRVWRDGDYSGPS